MNQDLRHFVGLLSSKGVRTASNLLFITLLARVLGSNGVGQWAMVLATGTVLHSLLLNWMHPPFIRFGREELQIKGTVSAIWSTRLPYLLIGFIFAGSLVILNPFHWLNRIFHLPDGLEIASIMVFVWLWLSVETQNFLRLRENMLRLALIPIFVDLVPLLFLAAIFINDGNILPNHLLIKILLMLSITLWAVFLCYELRLQRVRWVQPGREDVCKTFNYAWPLIPGYLLGYVSDWCDQLLLNYFYSSHEVGLFQIAYQFMIMLLGITAPLGTVLLPRLIDKELLSYDTPKEFLTTAGPTLIVLGLFMLMPVVSFAPFIFRMLMGQEFSEATSVLVVLSSCIPGSIILNFYGSFFNLQGRLFISTVVYVGIMSTLNVVLSLVLLPKIGILGAAVATSISYLAVQLFYLLDQHHFYQLSMDKSRVIFIAIFVFAVIQPLVGVELIFRFVFCIVSMVLLVILARTYELVDREWVLRILSGKFIRLGYIVVCVTEPKNKRFRHE